MQQLAEPPGLGLDGHCRLLPESVSAADTVGFAQLNHHYHVDPYLRKALQNFLARQALAQLSSLPGPVLVWRSALWLCAAGC